MTQTTEHIRLRMETINQSIKNAVELIETAYNVGCADKDEQSIGEWIDENKDEFGDEWYEQYLDEEEVEELREATLYYAEGVKLQRDADKYFRSFGINPHAAREMHNIPSLYDTYNANALLN